jgi:Fe-S cluster biogenesis protein NfuA
MTAVAATRAEVDERLRGLREVLKAHAGGVALDRLTDNGRVSVRFTGMCQACPLRPITFRNVVRPALEDVNGVTEVEVSGSRISAEAEQRLAAAWIVVQYGKDA